MLENPEPKGDVQPFLKKGLWRESGTTKGENMYRVTYEEPVPHAGWFDITYVKVDRILESVTTDEEAIQKTNQLATEIVDVRKDNGIFQKCLRRNVILYKKIFDGEKVSGADNQQGRII